MTPVEDEVEVEIEDEVKVAVISLGLKFNCLLVDRSSSRSDSN